MAVKDPSVHDPGASLDVKDPIPFSEVLAHGNIPCLLMVLVHLTGDRKWLDDPYRPTRTQGMSENADGGLSEGIQQEIRDRAEEAVIEWRRGRPMVIPEPDAELLLEMMAVSMGEEIPREYEPMLAQGLGLKRATPDVTPVDNSVSTKPVDVLVIGGGVSGLCAAVKLQEAGIPYTLIDKNPSVGGTWFENRYPACGVDTPSHLYTFSFARYEWPWYFSPRADLHAYLNHVADHFELWPNIRLETKVERCEYDAERQEWRVLVSEPDGRRRTMIARVVFSAVGALNTPKQPHIEGADSFTGPAFHSARWPADFSIKGKRVAVIGTGASAMQLVPGMSGDAAEIVVFQRSPQWAGPFEKFKVPVMPAAHRLFREVPMYEAWYRQRLAWVYNDRIHMSLQIDPEWPHPDRSINVINDGHRRYFTRYMETELGGRQDLLEKTLPDYPPFGKRMLLDNHWFRLLAAGGFELVTDRVERIEPTGVRTADGTLREFDVIVYATGFDAINFLSSFELRGRDGVAVRDFWDGDNCRAYMGMAIPHFPNFFMMYGPNLQVGHGGSIVYLTECEVNYIVDAVKTMVRDDLGAIEVREAVFDEYNERVDDAHSKMVWSHPGMTTYYRNSRGRVVVNNPFRVVDFWTWTRRFDLENYVIEASHRVVEA